MERHELGRGWGEAGEGWGGVTGTSLNEQRLFPHSTGSLEVALKASTAFMGSWLPLSLQSVVFSGSFGSHVWSPCDHALAPAVCPCPKQEKEKGKRSVPASPCPSTCSNFDPFLHDQNWVSIIGLTLAAREPGKPDISNQTYCCPQ